MENTTNWDEKEKEIIKEKIDVLFKEHLNPQRSDLVKEVSSCSQDFGAGLKKGYLDRTCELQVKFNRSIDRVARVVIFKHTRSTNLHEIFEMNLIERVRHRRFEIELFKKLLTLKFHSNFDDGYTTGWLMAHNEIRVKFSEIIRELHKEKGSALESRN